MPTVHNVHSIENTLSGYQELASLDKVGTNLLWSDLTLDFANCRFFAANMAAPLGVILSRIKCDNTVSIVNTPVKVGEILRKNGFLESYGYTRLPDGNMTTLPYQEISLDDAPRFSRYLTDHVKGKGIPSMTDNFGREFKRKLYEIFENSVMHSRSTIGAFVCGQYFPKRNKLNITIADGGRGIRENVRDYQKNPRISSVAAIKWAIREGNSTKTGSQPGGLGLQFLHEFITQNRGSIHIVSRYGFYEFSSGVPTFSQLGGDFPGTVVNVEINTQDTNSYKLGTQFTVDDIF